MDPYIGEVRLLAFAKAPNGWAFCNGQMLSLQEYQALFSLIGTAYGGNGVTTFGVPNLNGCIPIDQGSGTGLTPRVLAQTGGAETVALNQSQVPAHLHIQQATTVENTTSTVGPTVTFGADSSNTTQHYVFPLPASPSWKNLAASGVASVGGNLAHANVMPGTGLNYCICLQGIFPQQQ